MQTENFFVGSGREFDESEAADTTGESAEKEYSFERKGTNGVYEAKGGGGRVR